MKKTLGVQIVCEFNQNGEMGGGGGINYNIEGIK